MPEPHSANASADEGTLDTDFVHHLVRGAELLQKGDAENARDLLEDALELQPHHERGQNLLALAYFKLGLFDKAEELYRALVAEHPQDATLQVNLGLVYLKTGAAEQAIAAFSAALVVQPDHPKAQNYLGLAYLKGRDYPKAQGCFEKAGNTAMAERARAQAEQEGSGAPPPDDARAELEPVTFLRAPSESGIPVDLEERTLGTEAVPPDLAHLTSSRVLDLPGEGPFALTNSLLVITPRGDLFSRTDGLVASFGGLGLVPTVKRFHGRETDKPFGDGARRMLHVSGSGRLLVAREGRAFVAFDLGNEAAYFREENVFAFEKSLLFENGRVPAAVGRDLHLVHLRGQGKALLVSKNPPRALAVSPGEPCRVPVSALVGWHGGLTPRILGLTENADAPAPLAIVELTGEGRVLVDAALGP